MIMGSKFLENFISYIEVPKITLLGIASHSDGFFDTNHAGNRCKLSLRCQKSRSWGLRTTAMAFLTQIMSETDVN